MVAAVSAVSYGSYVLQRMVQGRGGLVLAAALGGMYSSTATTVALARRSARETGHDAHLYAGSIVIASGVMYLRLIVLLGIFNRALMNALAPSFAALAAVAIVGGWIWCGRGGDPTAEIERRQQPKNPLELGTAFLFALVFVAMLVATRLALENFGRGGVYLLAAAMGVTDVDPFVMGMTKAAPAATPLALAAASIVIAAAANNVVKGVYAYALATRRAGLASLVMLAALAALGTRAARLAVELEMERLVLAIDQGTHASRALVLDARGGIVSSGEQAIALARPQPDWAEQDGEEIVASMFAAIARALAPAGRAPRRARVRGPVEPARELRVLGPARRSAAVAGVQLAGPARARLDRRARAGSTATRCTARPASTCRRTTARASCAGRSITCLRSAPPRSAGSLAWGPLASFLVFRLTEGAHVRGRSAVRRANPALEPRHARLGPGAARAVRAAAGLPAAQRADLPAHGERSTSRALRCRWRQSTATSRRRCSPSAGPSPTRPTSTSAPAPSCSARSSARPATCRASSPASSWTTGAARCGRSKATSTAPAPRSSGCAPGSGSKTRSRAFRAWLEEPGEPPLFLNGIAGLGGPFWQAEFASRFVGEGEPWRKAVAVVESIAFLLQANVDYMAAHVPPARRVRVSGGVSRLDGLCRRIAAVSGLPVLRRDDPEASARGIGYLAAGRPAGWNAVVHEDRFEPAPDAPPRGALPALARAHEGRDRNLMPR